MNVPNPGSDDAIKQGCSCPILDNGHGSGTLWQGQRRFWISEDCPLHGEGSNWTDEPEQKDE